MVGRGGSSASVGKSFRGEARGRLVMVDMIRMWGEEGTKGQRYKGC